MISQITSFIAPALPVQIPVAYSPTDELLMLIGAATSGGAPPAPTYHVLVEAGASHKVLVGAHGDLVVYQ
jgi:hypothetical protein